MRTYSIAMVAACAFPANYGSPAAIRELCETLSEMGHKVHIVTYPYGQDLSVGSSILHRVRRKTKSGSPKVGPSTEKLFMDFHVLLELCRVIRRENVDLIHAHNIQGGFLSAFARLLTRKPLIYNSVNLMSDELHTYRFFRPAFVARWIAAALDRFVTLLPDHIIAVTQELYDWHLARGISKDRLTLVPCGIQPAMFEGANPEKLRARYKVGDRPIVMYTGINNTFQRVDYLLRGFAVALREEPRALLMVVSPIDQEPDLPANQALARELGVDGSVIWIGPHELRELPDYLALASVCVVPRCECPGHPIKLLNYMVAEKPIVCFAGAAKGVTHLREAWIVPNHDCEGLGQGIVTLLRDRALAARLAANARETALREFDWRFLAQKIEKIYDALLPAPAAEEDRSYAERRAG